MQALDDCVSLVTTIAGKVGGAFVDVKDQEKTGYDAAMQTYVIAVYDNKIEGTIDDFIGYFLNPLVAVYNHICVLADIAGIGAIVFVPGESIEVKLGKCQAAITDIETGPVALVGQIPAPDDYLKEHLNAQSRVLYRRYLGCEAKARGLANILAILNDPIPTPILPLPRTLDVLTSALNVITGRNCLVSFGGEIYAGLDNGKLMRWNSVDAWEEAADSLGGVSPNISGLVIHQGAIWGFAVSRWFEFDNGAGTLVQRASHPSSYNTYAMYSHSNGTLYGVSGYGTNMRLYKYVAGSGMVAIGDYQDLGTTAFSGVEFNGKTYFNGVNGALFEVDLDTGVFTGVCSETWGYPGRLALAHGKIWEKDQLQNLFSWDGTGDWTNVGQYTLASGSEGTFLYDAGTDAFYVGVTDIARMGTTVVDEVLFADNPDAADYIRDGIISGGFFYCMTYQKGILYRTSVP